MATDIRQYNDTYEIDDRSSNLARVKNAHVNTFIGGMDMDTSLEYLEDRKYRYAENIRIVTDSDGTTGSIQNSDGIEYKCTIELNTDTEGGVVGAPTITGETIIHTDTIRQYGIIFTTASDDYNRIYRLDFTKEYSPTYTEDDFQTLILRADLGITTPVSSVCRWEDEDNVKIYWADGTNSLRIVSITPEGTYGDPLHYLNNYIPGYVDSTPPNLSTPLEYMGTILGGGGNLPAGSRQYCYQLYNDFGSATAISPVTGMIRITNVSESESSMNLKGTGEDNEETGKSINLKLEHPSLGAYNKIRLYALVYDTFTDLPEVKIVLEEEIEDDATSITLTDNGTFVVGDVLLEEISNIVPYQFIPKCLETKDNYLIAANIKEQSFGWTENDDYDARAYRYDNTGYCHLYDNSTQTTVSFTYSDLESDPTIVTENHDCIPVHAADTVPGGDISGFKYRYDTDLADYVLGGEGVNIKYEIATIKLIEDSNPVVIQGAHSVGWSNDFVGQPCNYMNSEITSDIYGIAGLPVYSKYVDGATSDDPMVHTAAATTYESVPQHLGILNYQNTFIDSKFRSHKRGELYRYGIVFYDSKGLPGAAKWIADIRMPSNTEIPYSNFNDTVDIVTYNPATGAESNYTIEFSGTETITGYGYSYSGGVSCSTVPAGIRFTVKSFPVNTSGFEIVRVNRSVLDRSIVGSAIMSNTYWEGGLNGYVGSKGADNNKTYSLWYNTTSGANPIFDSSSCEKYTGWFDEGSAAGSNNPIQMVNVYTLSSPEIVYNPGAIRDSFYNNNFRLEGVSIFTSKTMSWPTIYTANHDMYNDTTPLTRVMIPGNQDLGISAGRRGYMHRHAGNVYNGSGWDNPANWGMGTGENYSYSYLIDSGMKAYDDDLGLEELSSYWPTSVCKHYEQFRFTKFVKNTAPALQWSSDLSDYVYPASTDYININNLSVDIGSLETAVNFSPWDSWTEEREQYGIGSAKLVGNKYYYNVSYVYRRHGDQWYFRTGPSFISHGSCMVFNTESLNGFNVNGSSNTFKGIGTIKDATPAEMVNAVVVVDMKYDNTSQYGGGLYSQRQYNVYSSFGAYKAVTDLSSESSINAFSGDTFISLFEYATTYAAFGSEFDSDNDSFEEEMYPEYQSGLHIDYIPMESSINTRMMHGDQFSRHSHSNLSFIRYMQHTAGTYGDTTLYGQIDDMYKYNTSYSSSGSEAKSFLVKLDYNKSNKHFDCRIMSSQPKTNDEIGDSWTIFKTADYLDVDTKYGPITALKRFNDKMFFFQENGVGLFQVKERSLISDNNVGALLLGTGDTLARYDYISNDHGNKLDASGNIVTSERGLYWYDHLRNEVMLYNGQLGSLGKIKGVQSYLNSSNEEFQDRLCSINDKKYNEILFTFRTPDYDI